MINQRVEGTGHVLVTKVPRGDLGPVHLVVVLLGVADQPGVLLGVELLVFGHPAIPSEVHVRPTPQLHELGHDFVLAWGGPLVDDGVPVGLTLDTDMVEARVTPSCHFGLRWVDLIEIANDCLDRGAQAVEVEPVEAGFRRRMGLSLVTGPEPLDEAQHIPVSPHPGGNAPEAPKNGICVRVR